MRKNKSEESERQTQRDRQTEEEKKENMTERVRKWQTDILIDGEVEK